MHILLIHQAFANLDEAGGTRHAEMAAYLSRHGHRVTIITSPVSYLTGKSDHSKVEAKEKNHQTPGISIIRAYTYSALHRSFFHRILAFLSFMISSFFIGLRVKEVDLVWGTTPPIFQAFTAWLLALLKGVPFLLEVRDLWPAFAIAIGVLRNRILIALSNWLERFLYHRAARLVINSPGFIDHVVQKGARWVELVPNSADPEMFDPASTGEEFRRIHNLSEKFVVMYAGAHGVSNDLTVLIDAAALLHDEPQIVFTLVGDGKEKANLIATVAATGLENIIFLPPIPKNEMAEALAASNACLAILKPLEMYKTTYPNKVFDYMAAGRPVIIAIDGVIREVVEKSGAGIFVPPGSPTALAQAILKLSTDPTLAGLMGSNGRTCIENNYNREMITRKMLMIVEEM